MFGVTVGRVNLGSVRGMAEELREKKEAVSEYEKLFSDLAKLKEDGQAYFEKLSSCREGMDRSLTRVVDSVREGSEQAEGGEKEAEDLERRLQETEEKLSASGAGAAELSDAMNETGQDLRDLVEQNKHFSAPAMELSAGARDIRSELLQVQEEMKKLSSFFRNISVMSLTAAIDAGRMGESASKFVQTAEDIRIESEKEERVLQDLGEKLQSLNARMDALDASVERMNMLQKEANQSCFRILQSHEERIRKSRGTGSWMSLSRELPSLTDLASSVRKKLRKIFEKQDAVLSEMESLGEHFMEEQKASNAAEDEFTGTLSRISFSACSQTQADGAESTIQGNGEPDRTEEIIDQTEKKPDRTEEKPEQTEKKPDRTEEIIEQTEKKPDRTEGKGEQEWE